MTAASTALAVQPLDLLAEDINSNHRTFLRQREKMMLSARHIGDLLLSAKGFFRGSKPAFGQWREQHTLVSQRQAWNYMELAKRANQQSTADSDVLWELWQEIQGNRRETPAKQSATPSFTKDDAEYILKINARAERGIDGEREARYLCSAFS